MMATNDKRQEASSVPVEPRGFGKRSHGLAAEYAHEQGWGLDIDERTKFSQTPENPRGREYDYGARDFGDEPRNTEGPPEILQNTPGSSSNETGNTTTNEASSMSTKHAEQAQPQKEQQKKHGDPLDRTLDEVASHTTGANKNIDPVPEPETGNHPRSHAAHLGNDAGEHTKSAGNSLRQGSAPGALRQPPQEVSRIGKQHRKQ